MRSAPRCPAKSAPRSTGPPATTRCMSSSSRAPAARSAPATTCRSFGQGRTDHPCQQESLPWDPMEDYAVMKGYTEDIMALWRSPKPTIAKVHGYAVAGGSDIALSCDLLLMADDARIGYMPTRVWGCPTTAMWTYRLGPTRAKQLMFTGDTIDGRTAADWGLANSAVPAAELDAAALQLAARIAGVPRGHLAMHKLVVNQVHAGDGARADADVRDDVRRHDAPQPGRHVVSPLCAGRGLQGRSGMARQRARDSGRRRGAGARSRSWSAGWTRVLSRCCFDARFSRRAGRVRETVPR